MNQPNLATLATPLKEDLLRPEAFTAVAPTRSVSLIETHISWVYVLDRDVFKVKKPVDLGFLNFRSYGHRRHACQEEVRLNARLAPGVYRGVVPITRGADGRCVVGGNGPIIDCAVHMERLSDEGRADTMLARDELSGACIDRIAAFIARFHESARADEKVSRCGRASVIERNVQENFDQTRHGLAQYLSPAEAEEIVRWQTAFVRDGGELFRRRIAKGRVREGHGDLRLEHRLRVPHTETSGSSTASSSTNASGSPTWAPTSPFCRWTLRRTAGFDLAERLLASYAREADDYDLYARSWTSTRATGRSIAERSRRCSRATRAPNRLHGNAPRRRRAGISIWPTRRTDRPFCGRALWPSGASSRPGRARSPLVSRSI